MEGKKICPYCGEEIMATAKKCRYCGEWLTEKDQQTTTPNNAEVTESLPNETMNMSDQNATPETEKPIADELIADEPDTEEMSAEDPSQSSMAFLFGMPSPVPDPEPFPEPVEEEKQEEGDDDEEGKTFTWKKFPEQKSFLIDMATKEARKQAIAAIIFGLFSLVGLGFIIRVAVWNADPDNYFRMSASYYLLGLFMMAIPAIGAIKYYSKSKKWINLANEFNKVTTKEQYKKAMSRTF